MHTCFCICTCSFLIARSAQAPLADDVVRSHVVCGRPVAADEAVEEAADVPAPPSVSDSHQQHSPCFTSYVLPVLPDVGHLRQPSPTDKSLVPDHLADWPGLSDDDECDGSSIAEAPIKSTPPPPYVQRCFRDVQLKA